jgi:hypothetical protein
VLKTAVLELMHFPSPHTGKAIADCIEKTIKQWDLGHIPIVITDSGSNMVKAFKEAKSFYSSELEDETIDQVATNSVGRDRPFAQQHPQQSTSAEDLSIRFTAQQLTSSSREK